jgi:hypothetical protein
MEFIAFRRGDRGWYDVEVISYDKLVADEDKWHTASFEKLEISARRQIIIGVRRHAMTR